MILRKKTILTNNEYKELVSEMGSPIIGTEILNGEYYTTLTDSTGYKTYHFVTDNEFKSVDKVEELTLTIDLSDAKDSVVEINNSIVSIPNDGIIKYKSTKNSEIKYSIKLDGWKEISGTHKLIKNNKLKLNWIKDE